MTTLSQARFTAAFDAAIEELDELIDRLCRKRSHLVLRDESMLADGFSLAADRMRQSRPFAVCDEANEGETVARFDSRLKALAFASGHQVAYGSTVDEESFREAPAAASSTVYRVMAWLRGSDPVPFDYTSMTEAELFRMRALEIGLSVGDVQVTS